MAPAAALAQDARMVELSYEITFAGFTGFRVDFNVRFNAGTYDAESHAFKEGLLRALTVHYEGRNRAWGTIGPTGPLPGAGSLSIVVSDKTRTWLAQYGPGGELLERHNPPWKPEPKQEIPEDKKRGSLDPLTGALSVGMAGDNACQRTVPSNDGKRRIDVILKQVGSEPPLAAGVPQAKDTLLICDMYTKRVAGEFYDAPQEAESERERPMRIWLGRLDDTPFRYPVKLEAHTGFGTIRGRMLFFRERPLSEQEKKEMRR
jgi:hypothetical protein